MANKPRILLIDIETAPNLGYTWGKWEQNVIDFKTHWYILSVAWKWLDERSTHFIGLPTLLDYEKDRENDKALCEYIWRLLNSADVAIAHNGIDFDFKKINARFVKHHIKPPSPYKVIDTLKMARQFFKFDSNKLDDLAGYLEIGRKIPHTGKALWFACMNGDPAAWAMMKRYNKHDVRLLEEVYLALRPFATNHIRLDFFTREKGCCTRCMSKNVIGYDHAFTAAGKRKRIQCKDCGAFSTVGPIIRIPSV